MVVTRRQQYAFTLVELSIVLVILGLLIGGVLTGQSLIRAAELRSVTTQYSSYVTAMQTFRDKYFALPGDMTNATAYWGVAHATPSSCFSTASVTPATCNGNGNGRFDYATGSNESFRFWQHLANAGLIEGSYSGISQGTNDWSATKANVPAGKLSASLWYVSYDGTLTNDTNRFDGVYDNNFQFGGANINSDNWGQILKPEEAYNIDMKVDDGKPATGKVVTRSPSGGFASCTTATVSSTLSASYLLNSTVPGCALLFRQQF